MKEIINDEIEVIQKGIAVVKFSNPYCQPCKAMTPILTELEKEYSNINFFECDVTDNYTIANQFNIMSLPVIIIFVDGDEKIRILGFKNKEMIKSILNGINCEN